MIYGPGLRLLGSILCNGIVTSSLLLNVQVIVLLHQLQQNILLMKELWTEYLINFVNIVKNILNVYSFMMEKTKKLMNS